MKDRSNMFIDLHQLQEIRRNGPRYTWTNKQKNPVMVTLDRIMVFTEWEMKHPLCFAWSKTRVGSDHWPILLDTREDQKRYQKFFYFEKQWLLEDGFEAMVAKYWETNRAGFSKQRYSMDVWNGCPSLLRQYLRGWNRNKLAETKKLKKNLVEKLRVMHETGMSKAGESWIGK
jgi:hypothetical protein